MKNRFLVDAMIYFLVVLFLYTGVDKLMYIDSFMQTLAKSILTRNNVLLTAYTIPYTELAIALLLLIPKTQRLGLLAGSILMILFSLYISTMLLVQKGHLPCSCGGIVSKMSWRTHLIFNILVSVLSVVAYKKYGYMDQHENQKQISLLKSI